jgi:hypothetical protein
MLKEIHQHKALKALLAELGYEVQLCKDNRGTAELVNVHGDTVFTGNAVDVWSWLRRVHTELFEEVRP